MSKNRKRNRGLPVMNRLPQGNGQHAQQQPPISNQAPLVTAESNITGQTTVHPAAKFQPAEREALAAKEIFEALGKYNVRLSTIMQIVDGMPQPIEYRVICK